MLHILYAIQRDLTKTQKRKKKNLTEFPWPAASKESCEILILFQVCFSLFWMPPTGIWETGHPKNLSRKRRKLDLMDAIHIKRHSWKMVGMKDTAGGLKWQWRTETNKVICYHSDLLLLLMKWNQIFVTASFWQT